EDGIRDFHVTGVQTCALPISAGHVPLIGRLSRWLRPRPPEIDDALWAAASAQLPWAAALDAQRHARLRQLAARFLHEKTITPLEIGRASGREREERPGGRR